MSTMAELKELSLNDMLGIKDINIVRHDVPEWNGYVFVRQMSADERSQLEDLFMRIRDTKKGSGTFRKAVLQQCVCDSQGVPMFADDAVIANIMKKSALVIEAIFEKCCEVNAFRQKDVETLKKS